jgi:hypothetical protein
VFLCFERVVRTPITQMTMQILTPLRGAERCANEIIKRYFGAVLAQCAGGKLPTPE